MAQFGELIKRYRRNSIDPERDGPLTQERLAGLIGDYLDIVAPVGATISNWENNRTRLSHDDRDLLMALVIIFLRYGDLKTIEDANHFLESGGYDPMNVTETAEFHAAQDQPMTADPARLQPYVPNRLFLELEFSSSPSQWSDLCFNQLKQLLRTVVTYVPRHLASALLQRPVLPAKQVNGQFLEGTLLFADISGFTDLSKTLREKRGKEGAEAIVRIINNYLTEMLGILFKHDGRLIKFGGDAMLCLFTGEQQGAVNAIHTAWEMKQAVVKHFAQIIAFQEMFSLNMKVGNSSGLLFAATVGSEAHMEYFFSGSAVERTAKAESVAPHGEIIISADTYKQVKPQFEVEELAGIAGYYRLKTPLPESKTRKKRRDSWTEIETRLADTKYDMWDIVARLDALTPYLPVGLLPQLVYNPDDGHMEGQHRQVTILFANFVGMSDIIDHFGADQSQEIGAIINEYFQSMQEEVHYYGGVINKVDLYDQGDKLMVIFGAPVAHERDARRAALTALAMQEAMTRLSSPVAAALLTQSIGIHSGFVFAGNVGSEQNHRREYTVMGDTVNLTARLMSAADSGKILVSQAVWDQIYPDFNTAPLDPVNVKGFRHPIPVFDLLSIREGVKANRPIREFHSEMVGRENELNTMLSLVEDLLFDRHKQIVALTGEGGVGKTRLVTEWQTQVADLIETENPLTWLTGYGRSYGQRTHGVFLELLGNLCGIEDADSPTEKLDKLSQQLRASLQGTETGWVTLFTTRLAYLGHFLSLDLSLKRDLSKHIEQLTPEILQLQIRLAICDFLTYFARKRPLILLLEDLHWADDASLALLQFVIDQIDDDVPILFCLIYRTRKDKRIWQTWQDIYRNHPNCKEIEVRELVSQVGQQLLLNLLKTDQRLDEGFVNLILAETDGNPLYIEEVTLCLIEDGILIQQDEEWQLTQNVGRIHVPDTLYQIIQNRIDDLDFGSPGARRVLWQAALLGTSFTEESLFHLFASTGRDRPEFLRHRRELLNSAMIARTRVQAGEQVKPGYQFKHGLVQQVAYENMPVNKRRRYHREVGHWLKAVYQETLPTQYDLLAYHFDQGEDWEQAFRYHWLAGKRDIRAYANENAAFHLRRALATASHLTTIDDLQLARVRYELGKVLALLGKVDDAQKFLDLASKLLTVDDDEVYLLQARIYYEKGRLYETVGGKKNLKIALQIQQDGLKIVSKATAKPTTEAALLHILGGITHLRLGNMLQADLECQQCLSVAEKTGNKFIISYAHRMLSASARHQGQADTAMTHIQNSIAIDAELGDLISLGKDYSNQGVFAFEMNNWTLAEEAYLKAVKVLDQSSHQYQMAMTCCNLADLYFHLGNLESGFVYGNRGLTIFHKLESHQGIVFAQTVLATLFWRQHDLGSALEQLTQAKRIIDEQGIHEFTPIVGYWLAQVYLTDNKTNRAEQELQALRTQNPETLGLEAEPIQRLWGIFLAAQGEKETAISVLQESLERLKQTDQQYQEARTTLALATILADMDGRTTEAHQYADKARDVFADFGAGLDLQAANALFARF